MKSQVLHTVWCHISCEVAGEFWHWSLSGVKGLSYSWLELYCLPLLKIWRHPRNAHIAMFWTGREFFLCSIAIKLMRFRNWVDTNPRFSVIGLRKTQHRFEVSAVSSGRRQGNVGGCLLSRCERSVNLKHADCKRVYYLVKTITKK